MAASPGQTEHQREVLAAVAPERSWTDSERKVTVVYTLTLSRFAALDTVTAIPIEFCFWRYWLIIVHSQQPPDYSILHHI